VSRHAELPLTPLDLRHYHNLPVNWGIRRLLRLVVGALLLLASLAVQLGV
jgi:hypothetical protein